jgi:hypothetical protein
MELILTMEGETLEGLEYAAARENMAVDRYCLAILRRYASEAYKDKLQADRNKVITLIDRGRIKAADCLALEKVEPVDEKPIDPIPEEPIIDDPIKEPIDEGGGA